MADLIEMCLANLAEHMKEEPVAPGSTAPYDYHEEWAKDHREWATYRDALHTIIGSQLLARELTALHDPNPCDDDPHPCDVCFKFVGKDLVVIPIRDRIWEDTDSYMYLCPKCLRNCDK